MRRYHYRTADATAQQFRREKTRASVRSGSSGNPKGARVLAGTARVRERLSPNIYQFSGAWEEKPHAFYCYGFGGDLERAGIGADSQGRGAVEMIWLVVSNFARS